MPLRLPATALLAILLVVAAFSIVGPSEAGEGAAVPADQGGRVVAWGHNGYQQSTVPAALTGHNVVAVAAGGYHSLALTADGKVVAWGLDNHDLDLVPAALDDKTVVAISAGSLHSLALTSDGEVVGWGNNNQAQARTPAALTGRVVTAIAAGGSHSLALTSDGEVVAWGDATFGAGTVPGSLNGQTVTAIAAGSNHSLAVTSDGEVVGWGFNNFDQATAPDFAGAVITKVAAHGSNSTALTADGEVFAWGNDYFGQNAIAAATSGQRIAAIATGGSHSLALGADGMVTARGETTYQQNTTPVTLTGKTVTAIAAGHSHSLALVRAVTQAPPTVSGTATLGQTLTATAPLPFPADAEVTLQWNVDGVAIDDATGTTLALSDPDWVDREITVTATGAKPGYESALTISSPATTVAAADFASVSASITGTPTFGQTLTAVGAATLPPGSFGSGTTTYGYTWSIDGDPVETGPTLALDDPAWVGEDVVVTATAARSGFTSATATSPVVTVALATLVAPSTTIIGTAKAGETLTAIAASTPTPDAVSYEWRRGDDVVGNDASYTATDDDDDAVLTVTATLTKPGYTTATATADSAPIATRRAPSLTFRADHETLRLGQSTTLRWTTARADSVRGSWGAVATTSGTVSVTPTATGTATWTITANNANGSTSATVAVAVDLPATRLTITPDKKKVRSGTKAVFRMAGLAPREAYTVRVGNRVITGKASVIGTAKVAAATGRADKSGNATASTTLVNKTRGTHTFTVSVVGSRADRTGRTTIKVAPKLRAVVLRPGLRTCDRQQLTVFGLASGAKVTATGLGRLLTGTANKNGVWRTSFNAPDTIGRHVLKIRSKNRTTKVAFNVNRTCAGGAPSTS